MYVLLGMAPPISIAARLAVACISFALVGFLAYRLGGGRPNMGRILLVGLVLIVTLIVGAVWDPRGVIAFLGGGIGGSALFVSGDNTQPKCRHPGWLIPVCLLIGPIVGIGLFGLDYFAGDSHPSERYYSLIDCLLIGTVAGFLGALLAAVTVALARRRPRA